MKDDLALLSAADGIVIAEKRLPKRNKVDQDA